MSDGAATDAHSVTLVARQAGSAHALAPVAHELTGRGLRLQLLAFDPAAGLLEQHGLGAQLQRITTADQGLTALEQRPPALLVSGTSEHAEQDARLWRWARQRGIPQLAFFDSWVNYWQRFTAPGGPRFGLLPQQVAVTDEACARRLVEEGCPQEALVITGNPALDCWSELDWAAGRRLHGRLLRPGELLLALFAVEPLAAFYSADPADPAYLGYTEHDALGWAITGLAQLARRCRTGAAMLVLPHPRQQDAEVQAMADAARPADRVRVVVHRRDRRELVTAADLVLGMTSSLLYEATLAGRPVVSLQPNRKQGNDLTDLHQAIAEAAQQREVLPALKVALERGAPRPAPLEPGTGRLTRHLLGLLDL